MKVADDVRLHLSLLDPITEEEDVVVCNTRLEAWAARNKYTLLFCFVVTWVMIGVLAGTAIVSVLLEVRIF